MITSPITYIHPGVQMNHPGVEVPRAVQDNLDYLHATQWDVMVSAVGHICAGSMNEVPTVATESTPPQGWFAITTNSSELGLAEDAKQIATTMAAIDRLGLNQASFIKIIEGKILPNRDQGVLLRTARWLGFAQDAGVVALGPVIINSKEYISRPGMREIPLTLINHTAGNFALLK